MNAEGLNIQKSDNIDDSKIKCNVFVEELLMVYKLEKSLNETLPLMILNAATPEIASGFTKHLKFTQEHLKRLEVLFASIDQPFI